MPTPGPLTTWSWQFLPLPADLRVCRNAGRNLQRWGMRYGIRAGTSDADKTRLLAARMIHLLKPPATRPFSYDQFNNQTTWYGEPCTPDEIRDNVFALIDDMQLAEPGSQLFSPELNGGSTAAVDWFQSHVSFGAGDWAMAIWVRAWLALNSGWGCSAARLQKCHAAFSNLSFASGFIATPSATVFHDVVATTPHELLGISSAAYAALTLEEQWLCRRPSGVLDPQGSWYPGGPTPSWNHHRGPAHRRQRHAIADL